MQTWTRSPPNVRRTVSGGRSATNCLWKSEWPHRYRSQLLQKKKTHRGRSCCLLKKKCRQIQRVLVHAIVRTVVHALACLCMCPCTCTHAGSARCVCAHAGVAGCVCPLIGGRRIGCGDAQRRALDGLWCKAIFNISKQDCKRCRTGLKCTKGTRYGDIVGGPSTWRLNGPPRRHSHDGVGR